MPIEIIRSGISYEVRNAVATPPTVPNVEIIANPTGPQLQAPADAPISDPRKPPLVALTFCNIFTLYTFIGITTADKVDTARINVNPRILSSGT